MQVLFPSTLRHKQILPHVRIPYMSINNCKFMCKSPANQQTCHLYLLYKKHVITKYSAYGLGNVVLAVFMHIHFSIANVCLNIKEN